MSNCTVLSLYVVSCSLQNNPKSISWGSQTLVKGLAPAGMGCLALLLPPQNKYSVNSIL
jgi:hypothetical protein